MHEQIARVLYYLGIHLLFASLVWVAAQVLTLIPRGSATVKHWIWVATSLNFILPAGAIVDKLLARHLTWASPLGFIGVAGLRIAENAALSTFLAAVWLLGAALMLTRLALRLRAECRDAKGEPASPRVAGILRPRILLPAGIDRLLTERELDAVLIHERTHAKRRDNLIRLVHEFIACVLWFHPLVWIAGCRLSLCRELSCDESVVHNARGRDLISALAKLATPEQPVLLQARASSFVMLRIARLGAVRPQGASAASTMMATAFGAALAGGVLETVAHTACCFITKH